MCEDECAQDQDFNGKDKTGSFIVIFDTENPLTARQGLIVLQGLYGVRSPYLCEHMLDNILL